MLFRTRKLLIASCVLIGLRTQLVSAELNSSSSSAPDNSDNKHNEHYHINKFNQLADDDRTEQHTEHTEDADDYNENDDRPEYVEEDYSYEDDEEPSQGAEENEVEKEKSTINKIPEEFKDTNQKPGEVFTQGVDKKGYTGNRGLKWFEKNPKDQMNPNQPELSRRVTPPTPVSSVTKSSEIPFNEADLQKHHNLHAKIMNIKENANRLNNEKVIYADEKFLLLKFQLTPLNNSNVQDVLNNGAEDIDSFERKFNVGKSEHLSGLFDSSIFDENTNFFDDFNDFTHQTFYPERPKGNIERRYPEDPNSYRSQNYKHSGNRKNSFSRQKAHSPKEPYFQGSKKYKSGKGVWIGNKYYPYHGPSFGKHLPRPGHHFGHGHDFSDEDSSDYSFSDCSDDYDESSEEDHGKDPGILYGKPRPGYVPTNGGYPGKGKVPGYIPTNGGDPGISNGKPVRPGYGNGVDPENGQPRPGFTPINGGDPGVLYGNGGDPGILYGTPRPGFVPTNGRGPGNTGPVGPGIIPNGNNGGDTGILYGKPAGPGIIINSNGGDSGILYGPGNGAIPPNNLPPTTGNNSDVVFLVIASQ